MQFNSLNSSMVKSQFNPDCSEEEVKFIQKELDYYSREFPKPGYQIGRQISNEGAEYYAKHIQQGNVPPLFVSKFIRANIGTEVKLAIITKASNITIEQLMDAFDEEADITIFQALLGKISVVGESFIVRAARNDRADILQLAFDSNKFAVEVNPELIFIKCREINTIKFLFANYPSFSVTVDHLRSLTVRENPLLFVCCIEKFIAQGEIPLPFEFLEFVEPHYKKYQFIRENSLEYMIEKTIEAWFKTNKIDNLINEIDNFELFKLISDDSYSITRNKLLCYMTNDIATKVNDTISI